MTETTKLRTLRNATIAFAVAALGSTLSSCSMMQAALTPHNTTPAAEYTSAQPQYIEDFYNKQEAQATKAPDPVYNFERTAYRSEENEIALTDQRPLDAELYADALVNGDIGGEDIPVTSGQSGEDAIEIAAVTETTNEFGTIVQAALFDPAKMTGTINIDLLMDDVSCFTMPVPGKINSNFGWRHGRVHSGTDLDLETGDNVHAAFDGVVEKAEAHGGYGNLVVIQHANGIETYYAHLSKILVKPGDKVISGDIVGLGGSTGHSTGPHLHFETRYMGVAFDPAMVVDYKNQQLVSTNLTLDKSSFKVVNEASTAKATAASAKYYTIRKGDTLGKIASKNHTTVSKLCKLNKISSKKILKPGQKLRIR